MLSRVAETVYWMARYLERVEDSARLINTTTSLLLDLPRGTQIGWEQLVTVTGCEQLFRECYPDEADERAVMRFLIGDKRNAGSILCTIGLARENARVSREVIPSEGWELINELYLFAREQLAGTLSRTRRYDALNLIVQRCQTMTGLLAGTMTHDDAYQFVRLGRNLERADMSSRILDVGAAGLLDTDEAHQAYASVRWSSVLKSLSAYQAYRVQGHIGVRGSDVVHYLLKETLFPRTVGHCLGEVAACLEQLPNPEHPLRVLQRVALRLESTDTYRLGPFEIHTLIDEIQIGLNDVHRAVTDNYFQLNRAA